uniref:H(+)-exporting diphosphatase n=1 Tax=Chrysotila carterae TaxID=13221 RepID=A0A7S4BBX3_CHRCT
MALVEAACSKPRSSPNMARFMLLLALVAAASAFQGIAVTRPCTKIAASRVSAPIVAMEEPSEKATIIGAAAFGGVIGVYFFHELSTGVLLAALLAYGATLTNPFGEVSKSAGRTANKVYSKTLELNEQYDLLPKAKGALDTVSTAAGNLNENYGITSKVRKSAGHAWNQLCWRADTRNTPTQRFR